ncbi:MAG TPA: acriflavine resistance protein B, partial [Gammaproteobacteria bacterium]|nr:acriflavine resistance protein B [Gammaproteobacteria bacterium]
EVEEGITIRIEEAVQDVQGVEELSSLSAEGVSRVRIDIAPERDARDLLQEVQSRVDAVSNLPDDAERPRLSLVRFKREVISVAVHGQRNEKTLRQSAERLQNTLLALEGVTQVSLEAVRPYEIAVDVSEQALRKYGLTLEAIASQINRQSLNLSAGNLRGERGEILVRTEGQAYARDAFLAIPLRSDVSGREVRLGDVAEVRDGFHETPIKTRFNGEPAVLLEVYRVGQQSAIQVANEVRDALAKLDNLPPGVEVTLWRDRSRIVKARLQTLTQSALQGGILVVLLLSLFLRPMVALWVCMGIPIAFMGGFLLLPWFGATLNVISLFAFIMVLGIVVDDAIVTGENVYTHLKRGSPPEQAAIEGTREVAVPVTFGVMTTLVALLPVGMVEGSRGPLFDEIPRVIIPVLLFSLIESKLILPAHLRHLRVSPARDTRNAFMRLQHAIAQGLERAIHRYYAPLLRASLQRKALTLSLFIAAGIIVFSLVFSGWMRYMFFPRVQSETARAALVMPLGTDFALTDNYIERITQAAHTLKDKHRDPTTGESPVRNILSISGAHGGSGPGYTYLGRVMFEITPPEQRASEITSAQLVREWRQLIGPIPGADSLTFRAEIGRQSDPIHVRLMGDSVPELYAVGEALRAHLREYTGVFDIADNFSEGKSELQLRLKPEATSLGVTVRDLARQVRQAIHGLEIQRVQRGRHEVKVMLRLPAAQRRSLADLNQLMIRTSDGNAVPFSRVAEVMPTRAPAQIRRIERQRSIYVSADVNKQVVDMTAINRGISAFLDQHVAAQPGVRYSLEGDAAEQRDSFRSLRVGLIAVLFTMYALLAIALRSYAKPLIVMSVIPFGAVGAVIGHWLVGMDLTVISALGILALCGVVVNDSLVLVDYISRRRREGMALLQAVQTAGVARFRAVILTSLTTFIGLLPLLFDKTTQAQFLKPMAVSLGFGILFATSITLILVPINYVLYERGRAWLLGAPRSATPSAHVSD